MAVSDINRGISYPDLNEDYPLRDSNAIRGWNLHSEELNAVYKICPICGKHFKGKAKTCSIECGKIRVKSKRIVPKRSALKYLIRNYSFEWIGRQFGVTGNTIKKDCDKFKLPRTKKEINSYSDEEWKKV